MNTLSHRHNALVLGALCFLAIIVTAWGYLLWNPPTPKAPMVAPQEKLTLTTPIIGGADPQRGSKAAIITIVEFGDFLCPSCADLHTTIKKILAENPQIRFVWKDMPNMRLNPLARDASIAARCASAQEKYWEYHDYLFEHQEDIVDASAFDRVADDLKLNKTAFGACRLAETTAQMVDLTIAEGVALGVDATPYFFIGTARGSFNEGELKDAVQTTIFPNIP